MRTEAAPVRRLFGAAILVVLVAATCGTDAHEFRRAGRDIPTEPATCNDVLAFERRMGNLGITFDYQPSSNAKGLLASVDAAAKGRIGWVRHEVPGPISGTEFAVFELLVTDVVEPADGPASPLAGAEGTEIEFLVRWNPARLDFGDIERATPPGMPVVVFLHERTPVPGVWQVGIEGLWFACSETDVARSAIVEPTWVHLGTLSELMAAATPPTTTTAPSTTSTEPAAEREEAADVLAVTPDGRFTYSVTYPGDQTFNGVLMVDDGTGPKPALRDIRDEFDAVHGMVFGPNGLVAWTSDDANHGGRVFVGRMDENGQILDSHQVGDRVDGNPDDVWDTESFDGTGVLTTTTYDGDSFLLDTATDPFFVMTAEPPPAIETDTPLIGELEQEGFWARAEPGNWYRGDTLGTEPGCGASTIYKDDADGYARVLDASIELDTVVDVDVTESFGTGGIDTVGAARAVILSTECPAEYPGRIVHWGMESIDYVDGGPRFEMPLIVEPASDAPVAEVLGVTTTMRDVECCPWPDSLQIDVELLDGTRTVLEVEV